MPRLSTRRPRASKVQTRGDPRPMRRIRDEPSRDETVCPYGRARKRSLERPPRDAQPVRGFLTSGHRGFDAALLVLVAARRRRKVSRPFPRSPPRARSSAAAAARAPRLRSRPDPRFAARARVDEQEADPAQEAGEGAQGGGGAARSATSKASLAKQAADKSAHVCQSCRQTFMVTAKAGAPRRARGGSTRKSTGGVLPELPGMLEREANEDKGGEKGASSGKNVAI